MGIANDNNEFVDHNFSSLELSGLEPLLFSTMNNAYEKNMKMIVRY